MWNANENLGQTLVLDQGAVTKQVSRLKSRCSDEESATCLSSIRCQWFSSGHGTKASMAQADSWNIELKRLIGPR